MDLSQFKDDPKFIVPLLSYRLRRDTSIGIPLVGITKNLFDFLENQIHLTQFYLDVVRNNQIELTIKKLMVENEILKLRNSDEPLHVKKMKLLDILALQLDFEDLVDNIMVE